MRSLSAQREDVVERAERAGLLSGPDTLLAHALRSVAARSEADAERFVARASSTSERFEFVLREFRPDASVSGVLNTLRLMGHDNPEPLIARFIGAGDRSRETLAIERDLAGEGVDVLGLRRTLRAMGMKDVDGVLGRQGPRIVEMIRACGGIRR